VNNKAVRWHFNLSGNKTLRTLETTAESMTAVDANPSFLRTVLSTITSPLPLDIIIVYQHHDFGYYLPWWDPFHVVEFPGETKATNALHRRRFKQLHKMYKVREFRPVLCADAVECTMGHVVQELESMVKMEKAKGRLDYLLREPLIISEIRSPRTRFHDDNVGSTGGPMACASAL